MCKNMTTIKFTGMMRQLHCKNCENKQICYGDYRHHSIITKYMDNNYKIASKKYCKDCEFVNTCVCDLEYQKRQLFPGDKHIDKSKCKRRRKVLNMGIQNPISILDDNGELIIKFKNKEYLYNNKRTRSTLNHRGEDIWTLLD